MEELERRKLLVDIELIIERYFSTYFGGPPLLTGDISNMEGLNLNELRCSLKADTDTSDMIYKPPLRYGGKAYYDGISEAYVEGQLLQIKGKSFIIPDDAEYAPIIGKKTGYGLEISGCREVKPHSLTLITNIEDNGSAQNSSIV